jgi:hypothetical protein
MKEDRPYRIYATKQAFKNSGGLAASNTGDSEGSKKIKS